MSGKSAGERNTNRTHPFCRGRTRHVARETRADTAANIDGEAYTLGGSVEPGSERGGDETTDDPEGWVNRLVFCDGDGSDGNGSRHIDPRGEGRGQAEQQQQQQKQHQQHRYYHQEQEQEEQQQEESHRHQQDVRHHNRRDESHRLPPGGGVQGDGNGDHVRDSRDRGRGRATNRIDIQEHHGGNNLSSRKGVTRRGCSEGVGQRRREVAVAAVVDETVSYAERLYRGHEEQHQVWEQRWVHCCVRK